MKRLWVGTSWKMNKLLAEAEGFAQTLAVEDDQRDDRIQRFVIPPFTLVREVKKLLSATSVKVGAQNMHWEEIGAWTGEISPVMLKDCGLDIVELGHSERREHFGETDRTVGLKVEAAVRHQLTPLVCVGETLQEREAGRVKEVLKTQVESAFKNLKAEQRTAPILLAYEPVWAIGEKGIPASSEYADACHAEIGEIAKSFLGRSVPCLYGGSVNPDNCQDLIQCPHIDGLFIGRSAWDVTGYLDILSRCSTAIKVQGELT